MAILKRFEIWLLLFLVVAIIVFATKTEESIEEKPLVVTREQNQEPPLVGTTKKPAADQEPSDSQKSPDPVNPPNEVAGILRIDKVEVIPSQEGSIVDLTLSGRSGVEDSVLLSEETLRVTTTEGDEVSRFFLPFERDPELDPDEDSLVNLKYWIPAGTESLWVMYRDQKLKAELTR